MIFKISIVRHGVWNLKKCPKVAYVLSSYPTWTELGLFSFTVSQFRDTCQKFHILARNLEFEDRSQSTICTLFLPHGVEIKFFSLYVKPFSRYGPLFKISIFWYGIWNLKTGPKVTYVHSFYPRGSKLSLF